MAYIDGREILFPAKVNIKGTKAEQKKTVDITENGTKKILPDNGYSLSEVTVNTNVASAKPEQIKTINVTGNGTTEAVPDNGYTLSKVIINTNVESGGSVEGFHAVRFYNDDRTTLLYTVYVPHGSSAIYAGDTPISTVGGTFTGFAPAAVNITADLDCYAVYEAAVGTLDETSWEKISELSADGTAQNYFAVGDTKMIHIEGTVGTLAVNGDYGVYIIGFDHNSEIEGNGIHFGTFKTADGKDIAFTNKRDGGITINGTKYLNMNHWGTTNFGGWAGCDMRYDILGSTDVEPSVYGAKKTADNVGYDATETCATNPVPDTLMAALPADLRAVMKPITKHTENTGTTKSEEVKVTATTDYLPLPAEFEIFGVISLGTPSEQNYQKQYDYYATGNSKTKYQSCSIQTQATWWTRSVRNLVNNKFVMVFPTNNGDIASSQGNDYAYSIAPIFKV